MADERDNLRLEAREILDQTRETGTKLVKLRAELQILRKTRDELNETVKALKKNRDQLRDSAKKNITTLKGLRKSSVRTMEGVQAQHEMARLEWQVQTAPLDREEEKRLMTKMRTLESKVDSYKKIQRLSRKVDKDRTEADELHEKIQELAQASQTHHEEIVRQGERFRELRQKLEDQKKQLDEVRGRVREVSQKYFSMMTATKEADRIAQLEKAKAHKEILKESAKKKLSQGEKLSLYELGALLGSGEGEDEEE